MTCEQMSYPNLRVPTITEATLGQLFSTTFSPMTVIVRTQTWREDLTNLQKVRAELLVPHDDEYKKILVELPVAYDVSGFIFEFRKMEITRFDEKSPELMDPRPLTTADWAMRLRTERREETLKRLTFAAMYGGTAKELRYEEIEDNPFSLPKPPKPVEKPEGASDLTISDLLAAEGVDDAKIRYKREFVKVETEEGYHYEERLVGYVKKKRKSKKRKKVV